jgi:hypothetical protein
LPLFFSLSHFLRFFNFYIIKKSHLKNVSWPTTNRLATHQFGKRCTKSSCDIRISHHPEVSYVTNLGSFTLCISLFCLRSEVPVRIHGHIVSVGTVPQWTM